jgi:ketosteroid isomerase-like protein
MRSTRLVEAINSRDAQRVADCFSEDYECEMPLTPFANFVGRASVLKNWAAIFLDNPRFAATLVNSAPDGDSEWTEWHMNGAKADESPTLLGGTAILNFVGEKISSARFYLMPVQTSPAKEAAQ